MKCTKTLVFVALAVLSACRTPAPVNSEAELASTDGGVAAPAPDVNTAVPNASNTSNFLSDARARFRQFGSDPLPHSPKPGLPDAIKNFRVVIPGVLYRGGVSNSRGFTTSELESLCKHGFSEAVYFYDTGFRANTVSCTDDQGNPNTINYVHYKTQDTFNSPGKKGLGDLMLDISKVIENKRGPVFIHCNNGWHATGIAAAIAAKQFCAYDKTKATKYLKYTTDGSFQTIASWGPGKVDRYPLASGLEWDSATKNAMCQDLLNSNP